MLGTLHLAVCDAATGRTLGMLFDVFNGAYHRTLTLTNTLYSTLSPTPTLALALTQP